MPGKKPTTAKEMYAAIAKIIATRVVEAEQSPYDWKVCVRAVGKARDVSMAIPIEVTATEYGHSVLAALEPVCPSSNALRQFAA